MDIQTRPQWQYRVETIPSAFDDIRLPDLDETPRQDAEWCEVCVDGQVQRIRFHNYGDIYKIPGLYEALFYETLKCSSPSRVVGLLAEVLGDFDEEPTSLRVLDVGAGNGMVGDELHRVGAERIVGVDIIPEAEEATERDRPGVYADYHTVDLTDLPEDVEKILRNHKLNCMTTVAALGFGDIPARAFLTSLDLIDTPGWVSFNIKEAFMKETDTTGFCRLIQDLARDEILQVQATRRYCHRHSVSGEPLHYVAVVARKLAEVPDELLDFEQSDLIGRYETAEA